MSFDTSILNLDAEITRLQAELRAANANAPAIKEKIETLLQSRAFRLKELEAAGRPFSPPPSVNPSAR